MKNKPCAALNLSLESRPAMKITIETESDQESALVMDAMKKLRQDLPKNHLGDGDGNEDFPNNIERVTKHERVIQAAMENAKVEGPAGIATSPKPTDSPL